MADPGQVAPWRVPDGVAMRRERRSYFVPIAACVALSFLISAALWWFGR
jgi:Protein of unknown function (DUF2905)